MYQKKAARFAGREQHVPEFRSGFQYRLIVVERLEDSATRLRHIKDVLGEVLVTSSL